MAGYHQFQLCLGLLLRLPSAVAQEKGLLGSGVRLLFCRREQKDNRIFYAVLRRPHSEEGNRGAEQW